MIGTFSVVVKCGYSVTGSPYAKKGLIDLKSLNSFTCSGGRGGFRAGRTQRDSWLAWIHRHLLIGCQPWRVAAFTLRQYPAELVRLLSEKCGRVGKRP